MNVQPFSAQCKTLAIVVTSTASTSTALPSRGSVIRCVNEGPDNCYISIGTASQTATVPPTSSPVATCTVVLAGEDAVFGIPSDAIQNISVISRATKTATLIVSVGEGQ